MNKLIIPILLIACVCLTGCSDDEPKDKTNDIVMSVSEEPGVMYDLFDVEGKYPIVCMRVMDEDSHWEWRNLSMSAIEGFNYEVGHKYTLKVRRTILANPPADASAYTYRLISILEDRIWPDEPKEDDEIIINKEEDIPYEESCPYHIYDLYKDAFVVDCNGTMHYSDYQAGDITIDWSFAALNLEFVIEKTSPDFLAFNRVNKMAYYAYVLSPVTDKIEKVWLTYGSLYLKEIISEELYNEIVRNYKPGEKLEYELVLANIYGYGLQKVKFSIIKE